MRKNIFKWSKSSSCNWRRTRRITKSRGGGPRCSKTLAFTGRNGFVTSDNTNEIYNSTISEISSRKVAGPSYDIGETADVDVSEFEIVRENNRHTGGKRKCCETVLVLEKEIVTQ